MRERRQIRGAALAVLLAAVGCASPPPPRPPNVIVVLVDTLRADRLGAYGSSHRLTPFLDELAAHATVFAHAYAQSSWTAPSVASLFTSRFPSQHGVVTFGSPLDVGELTIAEVLQARGYATGAFIANVGIQPRNGFAQGFDTFEVFPPERGPDGRVQKPRGDVLERESLAWATPLAREARPVFLYLHYLEPHLPYSPPDAIVARVATGRPPPVDETSDAMFFSNMNKPDGPVVHDIETVYDAEVASLDETLRDTFDAFRAVHLLDDAVIVFTADHGEEFRDHGHFGHGNSLYGELIHVPLLIALPGQQTRIDVREPVSVVDVAPTLTELAGGAAPAPFEGHSLRPRLPGTRGWWAQVAGLWRGVPPAPPVLSERILADDRESATPHRRAVIVGNEKLIVGAGGERERYDVARDPGEEIRLTDDHDGTLASALAAFEKRLGDAQARPAPTIPADMHERLRALGYL